MMRIGRNKENGLMAIAAVILMALFALSMLVSCKTVKSTTEVYVHDTLRVHTTDTIYQRIVAHQTDTVRDKEVTRIVLKESGDTIKVYNDHYIYRYVERNDSAVIYKTKVDSLLKVLDQRKEVVKVTQKGTSLRDKLVFVLIVALIIFCVFRYLKY